MKEKIKTYYVSSGDLERVKIKAKNSTEAFKRALDQTKPKNLGFLTCYHKFPEKESNEDLYVSTVSLLEKLGIEKGEIL